MSLNSRDYIHSIANLKFHKNLSLGDTCVLFQQTRLTFWYIIWDTVKSEKTKLLPNPVSLVGFLQ